ncbi:MULTISPECIES: protein kinase domain-containing protein [Actinomadura]|uniref:Protein kinase n=1 Tax=Actinomadura yumaensis TaxID=111807 RepID=A0ABW2CNR1_9ACTN|nr:protein kinase [Actinomadura sp. J1-007]MWK38810.1 protein kinase [Actinomadura sp. J1-007]
MDGPRSRPGAEPLRALRPDDPSRVGRYRIEAKIGEGGMGAVYLGRDGDGRPVAVKVVRAELAGDPTFLARFHDEAANAQRVLSFCTAQVLEHGEDLGLAYMVTEYIDGPSLLRYVSDTGGLPAGMLHGMAVGVAAALVAIHSAGLVHRDLKPSNVLLSISGPRVIDFGIARALDMASSHTRTGQVVGTPGWIAPEQILTQRISPAIDVFAWGCLVAFAASGRNPFGQGSFQVMAARAVHADPEYGDVPPSLSGLVGAALAKEPERRPTAQDLLLALVGGSREADVTATLGESWAPQRPVPHPPTEPASPAPAPGSTEQPGTEGRGTDPAWERRTDTSLGAPRPPRRDGERAVSPVPPPPVRPPHVPPTEPPRPVPAASPRRARKGPLLVGAAALLVAATAGGVFLLAGSDGDKDKSGSGAARQSQPRAPGAFPNEAMFVRIDTAPGWPKECHGDIGTYTPGAAAPTRLVTGPACDMLPERSPKGDRVAFTRRTGGTNEAWVMNANGTGARRVTDRLAGGRVTWSPDGTRLAGMVEEDGVRQIFVVSADGTGERQVTTDASDKDDPMWSSTGTMVFWSKRDGAEQIYTLDPERRGGPWKRLTDDGVRAVDPEWSPDGTKIAYTRGASPGGDIWVMNADGSGARPVTKGGGHDMDPSWSRDGAWICYVRGPVEAPVVRAVRADGTGDRKVTPSGHTIAHPNW